MLGGPGDMMTSMSGMMWGMAFVWALSIAFLVFGIAAFVKYLFLNPRRKHDNG